MELNKAIRLLLVLSFSSLCWATEKAAWVEGEILVSPKGFSVQRASLSKALMEDQVNSVISKAKTVNKMEDTKFQLMKLPEGVTTQEAIREISTNNPNINVQPNFIYYASAAPNDPSYSNQWFLKNTGQTVTSVSLTDSMYGTNNPGTMGDDIDVEAAWSLNTDCSNVVVAVLDTGAKLDHEDLTGNLWEDPFGYETNGYDVFEPGTPPDDLVQGHGTHVATTIGATGNNGKGGSGVCWKSKIMPVRVLDNSGHGTTADVIVGISYAVSYGAKIVNMSLGGAGGIDLAYYGAIKNAKDTLFVVAAGNDGTDNDVTPHFPCVFSKLLDNVICVAAVDQKFSLASFSNYGKTTVNIGAPGVNVMAGYPHETTVTTEDFSSGWVGNDGNWALSTTPAGLINPNNYDGTSTKYLNSLRSVATKTFDFSTAQQLFLEFKATSSLEDNQDWVDVGFDSQATGDIFDSPTGSMKLLANLITGTGVSDFSYSFPSTALDFTDACAMQSSCTIGFQLRSDMFITGYGVRITDLRIRAQRLKTDAYKIMAGTSMATPIVTGAAALVWSYSPDMTVKQVKEAILNGGRSVSALATKTTSGKVLDVMGALRKVSKPATPTVN